MMFKTKHLSRLVIGVMLSLTGCGTYVPEIQELSWDQADGQLLIRAIVGSIHCEIRDAVTYVINQDVKNATEFRQPLQAGWLYGWGAQIAITLTVDEQSTVAPAGSWFGPPAFLLGLGANLSSTATRINSLNYYFTVKDIYSRSNGVPCSQEERNNIYHLPVGSLLIRSDLKLKEWLLSVVLGLGTGEFEFTKSSKTAKNAFSHEVKFVVLTNANTIPVWTLANAKINPLLSTSRNRTHDLLITFGENDPITNSLTPPAANANLASQIGLAVSNQIVNNSLR